jgi:Flp pilus assembly protein TadG
VLNAMEFDDARAQKKCKIRKGPVFFQELKRRMVFAAECFMSEARGVAAVEFAFIAPIMLLLFVGTIELSAGISVDRKLSRLSSTISDLVTQSDSLTSDEVNAIMDVSSKVMYPYDVSKVKIVLSLIKIETGTAKVVWSKSQPSGNELATGTPYTVPGKMKKNGTFLVATKVSTAYKPSFGWASYSAADGISFDSTAINMEEELFLRPRIGSTVTLLD